MKTSIAPYFLAAAVAAVPVALVTAPYYTHAKVDITVTDKERQVSKDKSRYMIFTDKANGGSEVFRNEDSIAYLKWNSSDLQGKLKAGHSYECGAYGWRIQFFSKYRNLVGCKEQPAAPAAN